MVMISHGISTGALFLLIGMIYERRHTRLIEAYGGIARVVPIFSLILTVVALSSIGLPGLNGFVGEFLVLLGSFAAYPWATGIATTGVIFAAAYLLWALQRMIFNRLDKPENEGLTDLTRRELAVLLPLVVGIVWLGLFPGAGAPADGAGHPALRRDGPATRAPSTDMRAVARRSTERRPADEPPRYDHPVGRHPGAAAGDPALGLGAHRPAGRELAPRDRRGQPAGRAGSASPACC